jgi:Protein of unknown function (DUF998)
MATSAKEITEQPSALRRLLACGVIAPAFFIFMFLVEGSTRGGGYDPLRHPISALSIGDLGWMQISNFIITGLLLFAFAIGLGRTLHPPMNSIWGPRLIALMGISLIGAGIFISDPFNGYPPGTPPIPIDRTGHGILHDLFGLPVFLGLPVACFIFGRMFSRRGERGWAAYSVLSGIGMLAAFVLTSMGLNQLHGFVGIAGLFQRLTITIGWTWITLLAVYFLRASPQGPNGRK